MPDLTFRILEQGQDPRELKIEAGMTIGRHPDSSCVLTDPRVSGRHARVVEKDGALHYEHIGSSNQTKASSGEALGRGATLALTAGLELSLGETKLQVVGAGEPPATKVEAESAEDDELAVGATMVGLSAPGDDATISVDEDPGASTAEVASPVGSKAEKAEAAKAEAPKAEAPKAEAPKEEAPKAEAPKAEAPKDDAPKADKPKEPAAKEEKPAADKAEAPKAEKPAADAPKADKPKPAAAKAEKPAEEKPAEAEKPKASAPKEEKPAAKADKKDPPAKKPAAAAKKDSKMAKDEPEKEEKAASAIPASAPSADDLDEDFGGQTMVTMAAGSGDSGLSDVAKLAKFQDLRPRLGIHSDADALRGVHEITSLEFTIGRSERRNPELRIDHDGVSGEHATIEFDGSRFRISDRNSTNGTRVSDESLPGGGSKELLGCDLWLSFGPIDALFVVDKDHQARGPQPNGLYDKAVEKLVLQSKITAAQAEEAKTAARGGQGHVGLALSCSMGVISPRDWMDALELARIELLSGSSGGATGGGGGSKAMWVVVVVILAAAAAVAYYLFK